MVQKKVEEFIERYNLLERNAKHLVALSGGADSVALLYILKSLGYDIEAIHCNFHLRGEESNRDEEFCKEICKKIGVPLHLAHFDTMAYSALHHISIEMAARDLRYNHFRQLKKAIHAETICVAHHKDDCTETVLMNLVRGTGIRGLTGIRARNNDIIRPLLCLTRQEIEDYLTTIRQDYVTDSTNLIDEATRNKFRLNVIPMLKEINPSVIEAISQTARHLEEMLPIVEEATARCRRECVEYDETTSTTTIDLKKLSSWQSSQYLLYTILYEEGIPTAMASQIARNADTQSGKKWLTGEKTVVKDRDRILVSQHVDTEKILRIPEEGRYIINETHSISLRLMKKTPNFQISKSPDTVHMDADTIHFPLTLRHPARGDKFTPFGMKGRKLVSDFLTDRKLTLIEKQRQWCLTDAHNNILWVVGQRINDGNKTTEKTINILEIRYIRNTDNQKYIRTNDTKRISEKQITKRT